ncbi:CRAL-TRIO domain-containing protein [Neohortaea acidophila]|uniref:Phosphatidylinositol transfer protein SFH5 n=1 Tax=Neohortaea acidophila TaxID=245834 RepID=A0A6A6Q7T8_9PEZI|nr:CRAL-TRIO domain-containing protein [Neohortaea acidophila]KAF2488006.1 CRAL-TRIO domain-containing protein [Neohortaea acidophila]
MASPDWSNLPPDHNLAKFAADLPDILSQTDYNEMYGVTLQASGDADQPTPHTTLIILQKFLRANMNDLTKAKAQLTDALAWRKSYNPLAAKDDTFSADKFAGLGFVTTIKDVPSTGHKEDVATFNIYGAATQDPKKTFGDTDAFVRWRVALMELTLSQLHLASATQPIPDYGQGADPYQAIQIHDYLSVSFFRQPGEIKASSAKIIDLFSKYYPETVSYKYFVNVPLVMQWMMGAMKMLLSKDSIQKMTWLTYGNQLASYVGGDVPKEYGGTGQGLKEKALTPTYDDAVKEARATEASTKAVAENAEAK